MLAIVLFVLGIASPTRADVDGQLFILTSFPETLFTRFQAAFEARHPRLRVHVRNSKTPAAISLIQERASEPVDLIWVSAPDALEVLKESGHLVRLFDGSQSDTQIGGYPLDDPDGYYRGFAVSGYGIMWNEAYLKRHGLPAPSRWGDLRKPAYYRHIGISAPSRSGTTHVIVEIILQGQGWSEGWATLLEIGGNLATVTARSYGVEEGVQDGRLGIGLVIDFFGLSARALGAPVDFVYPNMTSFLPASIAMVKRANNRAAAVAFIEFLLSPEGQRLLFEPEIRRLPVRRDLYKDAPPDYPNPFDPALVRKGIRFDNVISG
ncbi:MAG: extracellular solute-binding protein, partial [Nitrospinae bacterium]|nr:extracellular solute-binding protein [Nitrospinota bacterium]